MAQDNYADAAPPAATAPTDKPEEETTAPKDQQQDDGAQTAELPKSVLGGTDVKPGEQVTLEVVQVMEDSVLCKRAGQKGEEEEPPPEGGEEAPPPEMGGGNPNYQ